MKPDLINQAIHVALGLPASELRWRFYWGASRSVAENYKSQANAESARIQLAEYTKMPTEAVESYDRPVGFEDYYNDLNAIAEARRALLTSYTLKEGFTQRLHQIVVDRPAYLEIPILWAYQTIDATAAQQCEALLRTLNLWNDET